MVVERASRLRLEGLDAERDRRIRQTVEGYRTAPASAPAVEVYARQRSVRSALVGVHHERGRLVHLDDDDQLAPVPAHGGVEPSGACWSEADVRAYLIEALDTLRRMRASPNSRPAGYAALWPAVVSDYYESYGLGQVRVHRALPTPLAIRRLDAVLPWFYAVPDLGMRKAMLLRAIPLSWRAVGRSLGVSYETARRWEAEAVRQVVDRLNATRDKRDGL